MLDLLIVYATRHGHTRHVAEQVARILEDHGWRPYLLDAARLPDEVPLPRYAAIVLTSAIHAGRPLPEMLDFVRRHRTLLDMMPNLFLSVSLSQASVEDPRRPPEERDAARHDLEAVEDRFEAETAWHPQQKQAVAGWLPYTQYGPFLRLMMRWMTARQGGPTDTSRDHTFTDWEALERHVEAFEHTLPRPPAPPSERGVEPVTRA